MEFQNLTVVNYVCLDITCTCMDITYMIVRHSKCNYRILKYSFSKLHIYGHYMEGTYTPIKLILHKVYVCV